MEKIMNIWIVNGLVSEEIYGWNHGFQTPNLDVNMGQWFCQQKSNVPNIQRAMEILGICFPWDMISVYGGSSTMWTLEGN